MNHHTPTNRHRTRDPVPLLTAFPYIRLYADHTAVIEESGVLQYFDDETVIIRTEKREVHIAGHALDVVCLSSGALAVTGEITGVSFVISP